MIFIKERLILICRPEEKRWMDTNDGYEYQYEPREPRLRPARAARRKNYCTTIYSVRHRQAFTIADILIPITPTGHR